MSALDRHRTQLAWAGGLVLVCLVVVLVVAPPGSWLSGDTRRSSLHVAPAGVAGWSRSLEALGMRVEENYSVLTMVPKGVGAVVVLEPIRAPSAREVHALLEWVRRGGVLVDSPSYLWGVGDSLGVSPEYLPASYGERSAPVEAGGHEGFLPHRWTEGVEGEPPEFEWVLSADSTRRASWVPLAGLVTPDSVMATLAWIPEGEGGILVVAEGWVLSNEELDTSPLAVVVTRALLDLVPDGEGVLFSEYHQGYDGRGRAAGALLATVTASGWGRVALHAGVVACLLLLMSGIRFGSPLSGWSRGRRSPLEHVEALALAYRAAGGGRAAADRLVRGAARRAGVEGRSLEQWAGRAGGHGAALRARRALDVDPPDLVALSGALDELTSQQVIHDGRKHDPSR